MKQETIKKIYELNQSKKSLEEKIKELQHEIEVIESDKQPLVEEVLNDMKEESLQEYNINEDIYVVLNTRTSKTYSKEEEVEVLNILKENNLTPYIKISESINKTSLNKELKTNETLQELLKDYGQKKTTEYIQVLDKNGYEIRKEKINESKSK